MSHFINRCECKDSQGRQCLLKPRHSRSHLVADPKTFSRESAVRVAIRRGMDQRSAIELSHQMYTATKSATPERWLEALMGFEALRFTDQSEPRFTVFFS